MVFVQALEELRQCVAEQCWDEDAVGLALVLAVPAEMDSTLRMNDGLYQVGRGEMAVEAWLKEFGFRAGGNEMDLATTRWSLSGRRR